MTKLTKTEQRILDHMRRRYGHYGATVASGTGPDGGRIANEGLREFNACKRLVARGLAELRVPTRFFTVIRAGYGVHCTEISIQLPGGTT